MYTMTNIIDDIALEEPKSRKNSQTVPKDDQLSAFMIAEAVKIDKDTAWKILCKDCMIKICAKVVPQSSHQIKKECCKERRKAVVIFCSNLTWTRTCLYK